MAITPEKITQLELGGSVTFEGVVIRRTEDGLTLDSSPGFSCISFRVYRGSMGNEYNAHAALVGSELFIYLSSGFGPGFISRAEVLENHGLA